MTFKAMLFDLDGVIADNMPLHRSVWRGFLATHDFHPDDAALRALDGRRAADIIGHFFGALPEEQVVVLAKERELLYRARLEAEPLHAVPGAIALLNALAEAGVPRVLATSAVPGNVEVALQRLGLEEAFTARVTAADVSRGKPDPQVYLLAAERAGVAPTDCLVAEDALPGLAAGRAAGCRCLGIGTSEPLEALTAAGAEWAIPDFTQMPPALRDALGCGNT